MLFCFRGYGFCVRFLSLTGRLRFDPFAGGAIAEAVYDSLMSDVACDCESGRLSGADVCACTFEGLKSVFAIFYLCSRMN